MAIGKPKPPLLGLLEVLAFSGIWPASVAAGLIATCGLVLVDSPSLGPLATAMALGAAGTLVVYNIDRLRDLHRDRTTAPARSAFVERHREALIALSVASAGACLPPGRHAPLHHVVGLRSCPWPWASSTAGSREATGPLRCFYVTLAWLAVVLGIPAATFAGELQSPPRHGDCRERVGAQYRGQPHRLGLARPFPGQIDPAATPHRHLDCPSRMPGAPGGLGISAADRDPSGGLRKLGWLSPKRVLRTAGTRRRSVAGRSHRHRAARPRRGRARRGGGRGGAEARRGGGGQERARQNETARGRNESGANAGPEVSRTLREFEDQTGWWSRAGSNRRPSRCERDALPTELRPLVPGLSLAFFLCFFVSFFPSVYLSLSA